MKDERSGLDAMSYLSDVLFRDNPSGPAPSMRDSLWRPRKKAEPKPEPLPFKLAPAEE